MNQITKWDSTRLVSTEPMKLPYALFILNRPISFAATDFLRLWNHATIRVLVDGGANEWFKYIAENKLENHVEMPHFLTGDMDSVSEESTQRLQTMNCQQFKTPDQNETDFTKSLIVIRPYLQSKEIKNVLIITDLGGRIDQTMSQINTLFKRPVPDHVNLYLQSHHNLAWLLQPGQHEITVPDEYVTNEYWCSYVPMNGECCVTTKGFKWDLTDGTVGFGGLVSTSNTYKDSTIGIHCNNHLLWSMGTRL